MPQLECLGITTKTPPAETKTPPGGGSGRRQGLRHPVKSKILCVNISRLLDDQGRGRQEYIPKDFHQITFVTGASSTDLWRAETKGHNIDIKNSTSRDFPGDLLAEIPSFQCQGPAFYSWLGGLRSCKIQGSIKKKKRTKKIYFLFLLCLYSRCLLNITIKETIFCFLY